MTREEGIFLIECLLRDVRLNWADDPTPRCALAMNLCHELGGDFNILENECREFVNWISEGEEVDGRHFRDDFPYGYEDMNSLHNLPRTLKDKSYEFKLYVKKYITCPDWIFEGEKNEQEAG